jgi:hypothetical protein
MSVAKEALHVFLSPGGTEYCVNMPPRWGSMKRRGGYHYATNMSLLWSYKPHFYHGLRLIQQH